MSYFMFGMGMIAALATILLLEHIEARRAENG